MRNTMSQDLASIENERARMINVAKIDVFSAEQKARKN